MDGSARSVANQYLDGGGGEVMRRQWGADAPAGDRVRLLAAAAVPLNDDVGVITTRTPVRLEFEFGTAYELASLNLSVVLYEAGRGCVFNTISPPLTCVRGLIRGSVVIPENLLNDGMYSVRALLVMDTSRPLIDQYDILSFQVHDVGREGNWYGDWIGAVRPVLKWEVSATPEERSDSGKLSPAVAGAV